MEYSEVGQPPGVSRGGIEVQLIELPQGLFCEVHGERFEDVDADLKRHGCCACAFFRSPGDQRRRHRYFLDMQVQNGLARFQLVSLMPVVVRPALPIG